MIKRNMTVLTNPAELLFVPRDDEQFKAVRLGIPRLESDKMEEVYRRFINNAVRDACSQPPDFCAARVAFSHSFRLHEGDDRDITGASIKCSQCVCPLKRDTGNSEWEATGPAPTELNAGVELLLPV
jgi:hypothetical protein